MLHPTRDAVALLLKLRFAPTLPEVGCCSSSQDNARVMGVSVTLTSNVASNTILHVNLRLLLKAHEGVRTPFFCGTKAVRPPIPENVACMSLVTEEP